MLYTPYMVNTPHYSPDDDKDAVDKFLPHLAAPCGTDAGNLREFYIREGERMLETLTDPQEIERLSQGIDIAKKLLEVEKMH